MSWSCAPAQPAPARIVTRLAPFSTSAAAASGASAGRITDAALRTGVHVAPDGTSAKNTSPGMTTTATPPRSSAARIVLSMTCGICSGMLASSQYTLHSRNSSCGCVSWKYCKPISTRGMCAATASTGTRLRLASYRPLIRCRLPGPQLPAHTASSPDSAASAPAANPAASS